MGCSIDRFLPNSLASLAILRSVEVSTVANGCDDSLPRGQTDLLQLTELWGFFLLSFQHINIHNPLIFALQSSEVITGHLGVVA